MDRQRVYEMMHGKGDRDYEIYLNTRGLLSCQKGYAELCNGDELQFQIVHQIQELWMKLMAYTLLDIDDYLQDQQSNRVITLFRRVHKIQEAMIEQMSILETMSPREYQEIRVRLGNGSGQESPGFRTLLHLPRQLWQSFERHYLAARNLTIEQVYATEYRHDEVYAIAEALAEFDELFQKFRLQHLLLIQRTIGLAANSLKGRSIHLLQNGLQRHFFPEVWAIRNQMTNAWSAEYGYVRDSLAKRAVADGGRCIYEDSPGCVAGHDRS